MHHCARINHTRSLCSGPALTLLSFTATLGEKTKMPLQSNANVIRAASAHLNRRSSPSSHFNSPPASANHDPRNHCIEVIDEAPPVSSQLLHYVNDLHQQ